MIALGIVLIALSVILPAVPITAAIFGFGGIASLIDLVSKFASPLLFIIGVVLIVFGARGRCGSKS